MCGISCLLSINGLKSEQISSFERMNSSIIHRGPDDEGFVLFDDNLGFISTNTASPLKEKINQSTKSIFGFRRLSIVDLSINGHQPMTYLNQYCIIFNGEIYNYKEIRIELINQGYKFVSNTDTEVIMASYDFWGESCLNKFNGMWSFVIYDKVENIVFIARDRFGIKPLYYFKDQEKVLFASEIKQMIEFGDLDILPNEKRIINKFNSDTEEFGKETDFTNVFRFPKASYSIVNLNDLSSDFEFKTFYQLPKIPNSNEKFSEKKAHELANEYYNLLKDAVRLRLCSDVPIGTCLSGGLDSSCLTYLINEVLKDSSENNLQKTFSLVFSTKENIYCDESIFIDLLTRKLNLINHKIEPDFQAVMDFYPKMVYHMDNIQHSTLMSYVFTYQLVKSKGVTVTIDGQGADELQAGYFTYLIHYFANLPFNNIRSEYLKYVRNIGCKSFIVQGIIFNFLKKIGLKKTIRFILQGFNIKRDPFKTVNEAMLDDFNQNLQTLLHYGDRGSMMHSVESRFPFMDYRIVEFWMRLPECYKLQGGYTKYLARLAFNKKLPDEIVWRRDKKGWEIPQYSWLKAGLINNLIEVINNNYFISKIDKSNIVNKININKNKTKYWKLPIKTFNTALWYNTFFLRK